MKKMFIILSLFFVIACQESNGIDENFLLAYKEILKIREAYPDTTVANAKVDAILKNYGYNLNSFTKEYYELAQNRENFITVLDSLRAIVQKEVDSLQSNPQK